MMAQCDEPITVQHDMLPVGLFFSMYFKFVFVRFFL